MPSKSRALLVTECILMLNAGYIEGWLFSSSSSSSSNDDDDDDDDK